MKSSLFPSLSSNNTNTTSSILFQTEQQQQQHEQEEEEKYHQQHIDKMTTDFSNLRILPVGMSSSDISSIMSSPLGTNRSSSPRKLRQIQTIQNKPKSQRRKARREKKEKKEAVRISLWIDSIPYEYGVICTFCTIRPAIRHCSACNDFYCESCDQTNHATKKRINHIRSKISSLTLFEASSIVTRAFRLNFHLKILQERCRQKFKRFFDKKSLNHYYLNTVYNTVSWKKPYCLRKQELCPFLDPNMAANRIQGLYYAWKAREKVHKLLLHYYKKIFDRTNEKFYYAFNGLSKVIPSSSWEKPKYCGKLSYPKDIPVVQTPDIAAILIQRQWRAVLVRESWRTIARLSFEQIWDPLHGKWNYYQKDKGILLTEPLKLMRGQPWDPFDVEEWSMERVSLFLRRIGLKHFVKPFEYYGVSGKTLLLLDQEDYANMEIFNRIEIKKVEVEISKIYKYIKKSRATEELIQRRERLRKAKLFDAAATLIQKNYRVHLAVRGIKRLRDFVALRTRLEKLRSVTEKNSIWYTEVPTIPSRMYKGDGILLSIDEIVTKDSSNQNPFNNEDINQSTSLSLLSKKSPTKKIDLSSQLMNKQHFSTNKQQLSCDHSMDNISSVIKLPILPIKRFGRKRDHLSTKGWGRRGPNSEWIDISDMASGAQQLNMMESHPTRIFTEKLRISGYDKRRYQKFCGIPVDVYEFTNFKDQSVKEPELLL